jgi:YbbR domain-containing protein
MLERWLADWPLKLVSLVIAFGLWVSITGEDRAVNNLDLPLEVLLRPEHILAAPPPTKVTVRLEGPRTIMRKLEPLELAVRIDLRGGSTGEMDVQLSQANLVGRPAQVEVGFFEPDRVRLVVGRRLRRELPVVVDLVGRPPVGYALYHARVQPPKLTVEGPEGAVAALTQLRTNPLHLEQRTRSFTEAIGTVPDRSEVKIVDPVPIEVRVVIDTAPVERVFDRVPIVPLGRPVRGSLDPPTARVVVGGPAEALERLTVSHIRPVAKTEALASGSPRQRVPIETTLVDLPEDQLVRLVIKSVQPTSTTVRSDGAESR